MFTLHDRLPGGSCPAFDLPFIVANLVSPQGREKATAQKKRPRIAPGLSSSYAGLTRVSIVFERWIAGSSPATTGV
jgi:cell division FtsZ-interacting protein ZapD